jgi:hypothetical protein
MLCNNEKHCFYQVLGGAFFALMPGWAPALLGDTEVIKLAVKTNDGLRLYDLDPSASDLWVVAGPDTDEKIDPDDLPTGFRWVTGEEWESLQSKVRDDFRTDHLEGDSLKF